MTKQAVVTFLMGTVIATCAASTSHGQTVSFTITSPSVGATLSTATDEDNQIEISGSYMNATSGEWVTLWEDVNPNAGNWVKEPHDTSEDVCELTDYPGMPGAGIWKAYVHNDGGAAGWQPSPVIQFPWPHTRANYMIQIGDHDDDGYDQNYWYFMN